MTVKYPVSSRLAARFWLGDDNSGAIRGSVTHVSQPLTTFWVRTDSPLPEGLHRFSLKLHEVTLIEGTATPVTSAADQRVGSEVRIESIAKAFRDTAEAQLAPLVPPDYRPRFVDGERQPEPSNVDLLTPWIHSTNRLLHLVDLIAEINSSQETEALLGNIMRAAEEVMEAEASSLMLLDHETGELTITLPTGPARSEISGVRIPAGEGFGGWVVENRQPLLIEDAARDSRFFGEVARSQFRTRDLVCVPMTSPRGEILGALQAINHRGSERFQEPDVALLTALAAQAAIALERDRLLKESIQKEILENELRLASDIQTGFWPGQLPEYENVSFAGDSRPARHVGGDYYDFVPIDEQRIALVIADVSGKGVGAALMMVELRAVLRARLKGLLSLEDVVGALNAVLVEDTPIGKFATLFVAVLNTEDRVLRYVNAGHDPPVLLRAGGKLLELREGGPIVGFRKSFSFPEGEEELDSDDLLVMFTDGVTETQRSPEEFFGRERLVAEIRNHRETPPRELIKHIQNRLESFQGDQPQHDDVTLLIARVE